MALTKLTITPRSSKLQAIEVLFNPNSYTITKQVIWTPVGEVGGGGQATDRKVNAPMLSYSGGNSRHLTLELFFDVTEPVQGRVIDDVRLETNKIVKLTQIDREQGR